MNEQRFHQQKRIETTTEQCECSHSCSALLKMGKFWCNALLPFLIHIRFSAIVSHVHLKFLSHVEVFSLQAFTLDIFLSLYWHDYRLRHNSTQEIVYQSEATSKIWTPDIYFPDALESIKHGVTKENKALFLQNDGSVRFSQR